MLLKSVCGAFLSTSMAYWNFMIRLNSLGVYPVVSLNFSLEMPLANANLVDQVLYGLAVGETVL